MSTTQMLYDVITEMTEEEKRALLLILRTSRQKKQREEDVDAVMGILHNYANPDLISLEKNAIEEEAAEQEEKLQAFITLFADENEIARMETELMANDPSALKFNSVEELFEELDSE